MIPRVSEHIQANGPMTFDVFMEMCLYDPDGGFFSAGAVRPGERGDFVTSPEISPAFGALVGRWVALRLPQQSDPDWAVVEIGAGSGSLIAQMVLSLDAATPVYAVERSEAARAVISDTVAGVHVVPDIDHITSSHVVVVMNEVLDNVPAALVRRTVDGWVEVSVGADAEGLKLTDTPIRTAVAAWADEYLGPMDVGSVATVQLAAGALIETILDRYDGVSLCIIDYGGTAVELADRTPNNVVRTYRHQRTGFDYLLHPGETDITVDVNLDALEAVGVRHGASVRSMSQRDFLVELGASDMIEDLQKQERLLASESDVMGQLRSRSEAVGVSALIDPTGFGAFKVVTIDREPRGRAGASYP